MRRLAVLAAAALGVSACMLENPGVDPILATARDRTFQILGIDFGIDVKARVVREDGRARFYLDNIGQYPLDSVDILIQASFRPPFFQESTGGNGGWPLFVPRPEAERFVRVKALAQGATADLGDAPIAYGGDMRKLRLNLVALGYASGARKRATPHMGLYEGRYSRSGPGFKDLAKEGPLRGVVSHDGLWYMWTTADETMGTFRGRLEGDTLRYAAFGGYEFDPSLEKGPILARRTGDTLVLAIGGGGASARDSVEAVLVPVPPVAVPVP